MIIERESLRRGRLLRVRVENGIEFVEGLMDIQFISDQVIAHREGLC